MADQNCPCCLPPWTYNYGFSVGVKRFYAAGANQYSNSWIGIYSFDADRALSQIYPPNIGTASSPNVDNQYKCSVSCLDADSENNVYVGLSGASGWNPIILLSVSSTGTLRWERALGGPGEHVRAVAVSPDGYLYVGFQGYIYKLNSSTGMSIGGNWPVSFTVASRGMVVDSVGNLYVSGSNAASTVNFISYDSDGNVRWSKYHKESWETTGNLHAVDLTSLNDSVAVGSSGSGRIYVCDPSTGNLTNTLFGYTGGLSYDLDGVLYTTVDNGLGLVVAGAASAFNPVWYPYPTASRFSLIQTLHDVIATDADFIYVLAKNYSISFVYQGTKIVKIRKSDYSTAWERDFLLSFFNTSTRVFNMVEATGRIGTFGQ